MKMFAIYQHPLQGIKAVKSGLSWPAFFFGVFWMLTKRLWMLAGVFFAATLLLIMIEAVTDQAGAEPELQALVYLTVLVGYTVLWLLPAFRGNLWRERDLTRRGYERIEVVEARTSEAATAQFAKGDLADGLTRTVYG